MSSDIPEAGLPVMQAGGMHPATDLLTAPAIGGASGGHEHPPAVVEGRAGRPATVRASAGCPACRGPDPSVRRLFVPDGAAGDRGRNISERLPGHLHAGKAGHRLRRPARRLEREAPRVSGSIPEAPAGSSWRGPARIAERARTGPGHDRHDRKRPFGGQADLPGPRPMAWSRDGAAGTVQEPRQVALHGRRDRHRAVGGSQRVRARLPEPTSGKACHARLMGLGNQSRQIRLPQGCQFREPACPVSAIRVCPHKDHVLLSRN